MTYQEKSLKCSDCGSTFVFTVGEQEFYASKGFTNEPRRCLSCRALKKAQRDQNGNGEYNNRSRY
jgi:hypothetical protein